MELKYAKYFKEFGDEFMGKVFKANLANDSVQKISFLSKLPGNLGDMILKDLENQNKTVDHIYWIDLLFRCSEKIKYLCWQKKASEFSPGLDVYRSALPWTPFKKRRSKRYGKFRPKRVANPKIPIRKYRYLKRRNNQKPKNNCCFICKQEGHFARKCPKSSSNKLKACVDIEEFVDSWSMVKSQDDISEVYVLTDASSEEEDEKLQSSQKMNRCYYSDDYLYCSEELTSETEKEYDDQDDEEDNFSEFSEKSSQTTVNIQSNDASSSQSVNTAKFNVLCPYPKSVAPSSVLPQQSPEETSFLKKIVKTNNLLYILD